MAPPSWISVNEFVNVRLRRENTGAKPERGTLPQAMSKEAYCAFLSAVPSSKHTHTHLRTFSLPPPSSSVDALVQPIDNGPKEKERRKQLRNPLPPLFTLASFVNLCKVREREFLAVPLSKECGTTNISTASFSPSPFDYSPLKSHHTVYTQEVLWQGQPASALQPGIYWQFHFAVDNGSLLSSFAWGNIFIGLGNVTFWGEF